MRRLGHDRPYPWGTTFLRWETDLPQLKNTASPTCQLTLYFRLTLCDTSDSLLYTNRSYSLYKPRTIVSNDVCTVHDRRVHTRNLVTAHLGTPTAPGVEGRPTPSEDNGDPIGTSFRQ